MVVQLVGWLRTWRKEESDVDESEDDEWEGHDDGRGHAHDKQTIISLPDAL